MQEKPEGSQPKTIAVRATLPDDERAKSAKLAAYAFSAGGRLIDTQPLDGGQAKLSVPLGAEGTNARVLVGPALDDKGLTVAELLRRGAVERHVRVEPQSERLTVAFPIAIESILCWLRSSCVVSGTVLKRTVLGGQTIDLPVCDATVEVYEVDPIWIILPKLPIAVIDRLRDIILHPIPLPDPPPDVLPGPFPGPFPPGPVEDTFARPPRAALPRSFVRAASANTAAATAPDALAGLRAIPELRIAAEAASTLDFLNVLTSHAILIRPILCLFYPHFFTMRLVATAETDQCGHFRTRFFRGCNNHDAPDLYFKVKQRFLFTTITIYAPTPVPCYTHWNYRCGTEVTLFTSHPLAHTCPPCPPVVAGDNWVLFTAIGQTSLNRIYGSSSALTGTTTATTRGLVKDGTLNRPFGGVLRPQLLFDNALRENLGVKYYRLFWRRMGSPDEFQMLADVGRHYTYSTGGPPVSALYKLGPLSPPDAPVENLYEIPPSLPPQGVWGPVIAPTDYQNGVFDTTLPAPGITYAADGTEIGTDHSGVFEIRLELFDTAGAPANIGALGIKYFVPTVDDLTGTITTTDAAAPPLGLVSGNSMIVRVHVDNNPTYAEIDAPAIGSSSADPCCGVLHFAPGNMVTLPWRAKQKNGYAVQSFTVKRVDQVVFAEPDTPVGLVGDFSTTESATTLMDTNLPPGCLSGGCAVAAFASFEYVTALATDGWSRLSNLDSMDFEAFTLQRS